MIDTGLQDRVVIVTGANNPHGIGAGIAKALAAQGVKIFLHYHRCGDGKQSSLGDHDGQGEAFYHAQRAKTADEVLDVIRQIGGQAEAWEADLSDPDNIPHLFDKAEAAFGQVDILVNNAAHWEADTFLPSGEQNSGSLDFRARTYYGFEFRSSVRGQYTGHRVNDG